MNETSIASPEKNAREKCLTELREAAENGSIRETGIQPAPGVPVPLSLKASVETGYYGVPLLKAPAWKWRVPAYFFTGGLAGASAVLRAFSGLMGAQEPLIRETVCCRFAPDRTGVGCRPKRSDTKPVCGRPGAWPI